MMEQLETLAHDWALRCFGEKHVGNLPERSLRIAEEAVELTQSYNVPRETLHELIDRVYDRPADPPEREMGGVMVTMAIMAHQCGHSLSYYLMTELRRVLAKSTEHFHARNAAKQRVEVPPEMIGGEVHRDPLAR